MKVSPSEIATELLADPNVNAIVLLANGGSMFPAVVKGDRLHLERSKDEAPEVGDIVFCRGVSGRFFVHRLVQMNPEPRTRGDALDADDEEIAEILAKVVHIEKTWRSRIRRLTLLMRKIYE